MTKEISLLLPIAIVLIPFFSIQILTILWMLSDASSKKYKERASDTDLEELPMVSLLLAARNEEELIMRSLNAIEKLDYPKDKIEILIGNDASKDRTEELVNEFIKDKPNFSLYNIESTLGKGRGKANVLAHLAHEAKGEYYFITDVDVLLPESWIKRLLFEFDTDVALVSGTTMCERGSVFATMQSIDWLHFMGYIKAFATVGVSCTSVGNNMAVRAKAYWETGGYENMDFSITEDYKLFKELTEKGWEWRNILDKESLGFAWYIKDVKEMLHQRKRWLIGARELPWNWKILIIIYGLFIPALLYLFIVDPLLALQVWLAKTMLQIVFIGILSMKAEIKPFRFVTFLLYELYVAINTISTAIFYILPIKSSWKGRIYNADYLKEQ